MLFILLFLIFNLQFYNFSHIFFFEFFYLFTFHNFKFVHCFNG